MSGRKKFWVLVPLLLVAMILGMVWHMTHYIMIDFRFYPKDAQSLDLRGEEISIAHYEKLSRRLPGCEVRWDVPFQGSVCPDDTRELSIASLAEEDLKALDHLRSLETVRAEQCRDYDQLLALQERRPELEICFSLELGGTRYSQDAAEVRLDSITKEQIRQLQLLRQLGTVAVYGGENTQNMAELQEYCRDNGISFCVELDGIRIADTETAVTVRNITDGELNLLHLLPELQTLHLIEPAAKPEALAAAREACPEVEIFWEKEVAGLTFTSGDTEIDLSALAKPDTTSKNNNTYTTAAKEEETPVPTVDLAEVESAMEYFPDAQTLFLGECGIDNETLAAFRERHREDYKVVWTVRFNGKLPTRTDTTDFYPARDGLFYFSNKEAYNLRYCEDIVCMDLGHMTLDDVSFLAYMPDLEYLILAHTQVRYIDGIENCKKLKYLELDWSCIQDLSPLVGCTALEDLNIGLTWPDITPVLEMTWLKNLYMIGGDGGDAWKASQALPNTRVIATGTVTVSSGWRNLPNYYAMRDYLGVPYMN